MRIIKIRKKKPFLKRGPLKYLFEISKKKNINTLKQNSNLIEIKFIFD